MTIPTPKGFTYVPIYEPDEERMLRALRTVLESPKRKEEPVEPLLDKKSGKNGGAA